MDPRRAKRQLSEDTFAGTTEVPNKRLYILSSDTGTASEGSNTLASQAEFHGSGIQHSGRGNFNVRGNVSITTKPLSNSEKAEKCIRQLFLTDPSEDRDTLKRKKGNRADGTCEWIIGTDELTAWLSSEKASMGAQIENVLWLHGNPGTGKSTTAIFLTEELSKRFSNIEGKTLTYFFCDASFEQRKTATSIIRGLLFQLVQAHRQLLLTYVLPQYEERGDKIFTSFNTLWKIFVEAAADHSTGQKYCIIDALDECDKDSQEILLHQLRETFYNQHSSPPNIRIIITSRPYPEIQEYLEDFIHKDLASFDQTRQDIDRCIKERVDELAKKKRYTVKVKEEVSNMLREKAEGTFLWVGLACEELRGKPSKDAIRFLTAMPKGLTSLYRKLLEMVVEHESNEGDIIRRILGFVAVSVEVLGLLELSDACQLNEDEQDVDTRLQYTRDLIASCRLLVVIQDAKVQLLHQSVRDFLVGDSSSSFINRFGAHADAAYRCVDVLIEHFHNHNKHKGSQSFLKYATHNWPAHARAAQDKFRIHDSQKTFFKQFSPCMESWLRSLPSPHFRSLSGLIYEYYPPKFSLLHVAAWWGLPALVEYALEKQTIMGEPSPLMDVNCVDAWGATPLEWAVESAHTDTFDILLQRGANVGEKLVRRVAWKRNELGKEFMTLLLSRNGDQIMITKDTVQVVVANSPAAKEFFSLLIERRGHQFGFTSDVFKAAVSNGKSGRDIIELFLQHQGSQIIITEEMMMTAIQNANQGREIIELFLQHQGSHIIITEEMMMTATRNRGQGREIIELFLQHQGSHIIITEDVMMTAIQNEEQGRKIIELFLQHQGSQIIITEEIMEGLIRIIQDKNIMELLLQHGKSQVLITEAMIIATVENWYSGKEILELLLQHLGEQVTITDDIMMAAIQSEMQDGKIFQLLLQHRGDQIIVTEAMVTEAIRCSHYDLEIIKILLQRQEDSGFNVTEEMLNAAAGNAFQGREIMEILLQRQENWTAITQETVEIAANTSTDEAMMEFLFQHEGNQITITEEISRAAAKNIYSKGPMEFLLRRCGNEILITEEIMQAAFGNKEILELLLQQRGDQITITTKILETAAKHFRCDVIDLLLQHRGGDHITITEEMVKAASWHPFGSENIIKSLLQRCGDGVCITEGIVMASIGGFCGDKVLKHLLQHHGSSVTITENVVITVAEKTRGSGLLYFLIQKYGDEVPVTNDLVEAAARNEYGTDTVAFLLKRLGDKFRLTEKLVVAAVENQGSGMEVLEFLLQQHESAFTITERIVQAAAGNPNGKEILNFLLEQHGTEFTITEEIVQAAVKNTDRGKEVLKLLIEQRGDEITITQAIVQAAAENESQGKNILKFLLAQRGDEFSITEEIVRAAARNFLRGRDFVSFILQERGNEFTITEGILVECVRNIHDGLSILKFLLRERAHQITITEEIVYAAQENSACYKGIIKLFTQNAKRISITKGAVEGIDEIFGREASVSTSELDSDIESQYWST